VAKLWPSLSVLLVVVMLLFLAPTLLLLPAQIVSADGAAVTQEVAGSLSFNESLPGEWWPFTAGDNGINATYGLYFAQYTRADVKRTAAQGVVPNCAFRNYTTASGSVSGSLSGSLSLAWIAFNFNLKYPNTTLYHDYGTGAHFGWMAGRGHFYATNTSNNFTFAFIADFDSDNGNMSNAMGKGFLMSVEENGTFGKTNGTDPETNKIIGDFNFTKSGANYTATYNFRIYPPNEVYDLSWLNVTGGVVQEPTDDISAPLALLDFETDGPQVTPTNMTTDFEEVGWGKDSPKVVTTGRLGVGGDMVVARNTALYLELDGLNSTVRIMGTTINNIYIDDTNTGNRTGDGSPYGKLWELLALFIPNQLLPVNDNFTQEGYTLTPFGMLYEGTQCYAGTENFAFATINISSSLSDALQWSVDHSYGLYPTPKVTSVIPASASPGATLNVTITGKYFLRADNYVANSGSVSFGPNITVNSYTIKNSSAIGNEITANITIAGDAPTGARNVNVTSCFGYSSGSGTDPYETGTKVDGFSVVTAGSGVEGHVSFLRSKLSPDPTWETGLVVRGFVGGSKVWEQSTTTNDTGVFTITGLTPGTYDIGIKNGTTLSKVVTGVVLNSTAVVDFGALLEGDIAVPKDNKCNILDLSALGGVFGTTTSIGGPGDLNRDGKVNILDLSALGGNFGLVGQLPW